MKHGRIWCRWRKLGEVVISCTLALTLCLIVGCGGGKGLEQPPEGPPSGGGGGQPGGLRTISGRVTNAANPTQGIRNAAVKLFPSNLRLVNGTTRQAPINQTTTDANGNFSLTANDGEYLLRVELPDGTFQAVEIGLTVTGNINLNVRLVPREIRIARVEVVIPPGDGPGGSYLVGKSYRFRAKAFDPNGQEITTPLVPNWQVVGGIGTIADDGTFTATSPGTGKIIAIFTADKRFEATISVSQASGPNQKPNKPTLIEPSNQAVVTGRPTFRFSASDPDGNLLRFKIEVLKDGAPFRTYDQTQDTTGWSKPNYASGEAATFVPPTPLPAGDYQWLVYAYDGRDWSDRSEIRSFTVNNPPTNLTMIAPEDNAFVDKRPQFKVSATDPDGDRLHFKIELLQNGNVVKIFDQMTNPAGWDQTDYSSGATATFTVPEPLGLGNYQWRFYAHDGRAWSDPSPIRNFSIAPTAVLVGSSQSNPLRDLLVSNGFRVTMQDTVPTDIGTADVLIIDDTLSLSTSDAPKVEQLLNAGKSVVLIGHAPAMLATGTRLPTNGNTVDVSSISGWFGGVTKMKVYLYSSSVYVWDTSLFPLPTGMKSDDEIFYGYQTAACTTAPTSPGKIAAADGKSDWNVTRIYAFAYPSPATNSRLYWQWAHTGDNPAYASKVNSLFIAAVKWAARVPTSKMPHWVRSRRR